MRSLPILTTPVLATPRCDGCGRCCKASPGLFVPEDFGGDFARMREAVSTGSASIDWWEGGGEIYYLRPATKDGAGEVFDPSWGGECIHLSATGCGLTYEARPRQCRGLVPGDPDAKDTSCVELGTEKRDFVAAWEEWSERVHAMGRELERESA